MELVKSGGLAAFEICQPSLRWQQREACNSAALLGREEHWSKTPRSCICFRIKTWTHVVYQLRGVLQATSFHSIPQLPLPSSTFKCCGTAHFSLRWSPWICTPTYTFYKFALWSCSVLCKGTDECGTCLGLLLPSTCWMSASDFGPAFHGSAEHLIDFSKTMLK